MTILLLGVDNAGKTTLLANLLHEPPAYVVPTIGYRQVCYKHKRAQITFIDLGGGHSIRTIWHNYYAMAHAALFILDVSDLERLEESREVLSEVTQHALMQDKPILVFGNKQDMLPPGGADSVERLFGMREDSCPSQMTDTNSLDTSERNLDSRSDVIRADSEECNPYKGDTLQQDAVHMSSQDVHCGSATMDIYSSLVERELIRFRYCSAINQGKEMRQKVILKSLSWLLRAVRSHWNKLESRVCADSSEQLEREKRERRERAEHVRMIKEQRQLEAGPTQDRPNSGDKNPFLPIARAVEKAETRENVVISNPMNRASCEHGEGPAPPDSEEAAAEIAQYFEDASKRNTGGLRNRTMLDVEERVYIKHIHSDPGIPASHHKEDEFRMQRPLHTIHEGPSNSFFHKRGRRNRIAPMESTSLSPLGPLKSSPGSPPSSLFQSFQKSQRQMENEVYPLMPSNPWCRPFTPDSEEGEEPMQTHQILNSIQESNSLPDLAENLD